MITAQFTTPLTIALSPNTRKQIKRISDARNISMAEVVRSAIKSFLEKENIKEDEIND